jgi:hypothetical protein
MLVIDELDNHVSFARGIELAVMGEAMIGGWDSSPITRLIDHHVRALNHLKEVAHRMVEAWK